MWDFRCVQSSRKIEKYFRYRPARANKWVTTRPLGGTCISRRFHIGYVNSRRMCVVGLDWQPTTPTRRRELSHTLAYYVIRPIPEGAFVILYENAPCAPVLCAWSLSFFRSCREEPSRVTRCDQCVSVREYIARFGELSLKYYDRKLTVFFS